MSKYALLSSFFISSLFAQQAPNNPSDLVLLSQTPHTVLLSWKDESLDESGFKIYIGADLIHTTASDVTSYTDSGLLANHRYIYTVKATNDSAKHKRVVLDIQEYADDAEEDAYGSVDLYSKSLNIVKKYNNQLIAMRFQSVNIPQNAQIAKAYLRFKTREVSSQKTNLIIQAEASDNAAAFRYKAYGLSSRELTRASVDWSPEAWGVVGEHTQKQESSDLRVLVQEVVDRSGWREGNAIALYIQGVGRRVANSFDGEKEGAPKLIIEYVESGVPSPSTKEVKIAMIGDQGVEEASKDVLRLIKSEQADMLLIAGDFDYIPSAGRWERMHRDILGSTFPILAVAGNHDVSHWSSYQAVIARWQENPLFNCEGEAGKYSSCDFKGVKIVMTVPNLFDGNSKTKSEQYIKKSFEKDSSAWRICSFHKTMRDMQTGDKKDETGWGVYEACRKQGAMIVTGHEHAYSRSYLFSDIPSKSVSDWQSPFKLEKGKTLVAVSGMGGKSARTLKHDNYWWAAKASASTGTRAGVLFCTYGVDNDSNKASCYFKDIKGKVLDRFSLESGVNK